jgi:hypothetical protein
MVASKSSPCFLPLLPYIIMERIHLKKTCSLSRFKYALKLPRGKRRLALKRAVKAYGSGYVIRKLVVLRTYRKGSPELRRQYCALDSDIRFVQTFRDAMTASARKKDLMQYRLHTRLKNSEKTF